MSETVYRAGDSFVCDHGVFHKGRLVVGSHPCVQTHPTNWEAAGVVEPDWAARIGMMAEDATMARLAEHITPMGAPEPVPTPGATQWPAEPVAAELTRDQILTAYRDWIENGPPSVYKRLNVSESTLYRYRRKVDLVPWPTD